MADGIFININESESTANENIINEIGVDVATVAGNIDNVNTVANNISNVNSVAANQTNINAVNSNKTNINTVAGINDNISTIAGNIDNVNTVANNISNVNSVAANQTNINAVNSNKTNINTVAGNIDNVNTIATNINLIEDFANGIDRIELLQEQLDRKQNADDEVYDFFINDVNESNPANCVTYAGTNTSFTPAGMNYTTQEFNYGSWNNAFFLKIFKPCMLKSDGTVDYYLDPNDYTKKDDGVTASDIANTSYDGNAMVQIGQIWIAEENTTDGKKHIRIANRKITSDFECITHRKKDGTYLDYIYRSLYDGSLINNKIRSISGQTVCKNQTGNNQITYAKANGANWNIDEYAVRRLIQYLLILMGKSLNTQTIFGNGVTSGAEAGQVITGTLNDKGMFWGSNGTTSAVKVFHMENLWGNNWKITNGLIAVNGRLKYKMCEGQYDGSTTDDYNTNGSGYIDSGVTLSGTSGSFIKDTNLVPGLGIVPSVISGSDSTYYCDGTWFNASLADGFARFGGASNDGSKCGVFYLDVGDAVGTSAWYYGAALSYKAS